MYKVVLVQGPTWTCLVLIDSKVKRALIIYSRGAEPSEPWGRGGPHPPYFGRLVITLFPTGGGQIMPTTLQLAPPNF